MKDVNVRLPVTPFSMAALVVCDGLWRYIHGRTYRSLQAGQRLPDCWYQDEILAPIVRPYIGAVGPEFLLVHDNARPHVMRL